jgi:glycosyltransferase involved in cell wall biosynthesis
MRIIFTVTNDLNYDQRMNRIAESLIKNGYKVKLIGRKFSNTTPLQHKGYQQKRLPVFFKKGFSFYFEYNLKLFFYLLFQKADIFCCIDLDTMLPVFSASFLKRKIKVYDAHEYFSQQKEIITRPRIYHFWYFIEKTFVPKFRNGYTVSEGIAEEFLQNYHVKYSLIRNVPLLKLRQVAGSKEKIIIYQGSVNEARGFEYLIPAMKNIDAILWIFGDGNFFDQAKCLVETNDLQHKIIFQGKCLPADLSVFTSRAMIGINLVEAVGKNQVLSLANKFFDYMHQGLPQVTMDFPEYKKINNKFEIAILIKSLSVDEIVTSLELLLQKKELYLRLQQNCLEARKVFNWQNEEKRLLDFYKKLKAGK